jgi:hypothetical protein
MRSEKAEQQPHKTRARNLNREIYERHEQNGKKKGFHAETRRTRRKTFNRIEHIEHKERKNRNGIFDRIYRMNRIREMNGLNSVAKGVVYSETLCDAAKLRLISWDSQGPRV